MQIIRYAMNVAMLYVANIEISIERTVLKYSCFNNHGCVANIKPPRAELQPTNLPKPANHLYTRMDPQPK